MPALRENKGFMLWRDNLSHHRAKPTNAVSGIELGASWEPEAG
jgi:hypothetical protein